MSIIAVHAEVQTKPSSLITLTSQQLLSKRSFPSGLHCLQGPGSSGSVEDREISCRRDVSPDAVRFLLQQKRRPAGTRSQS